MQCVDANPLNVADLRRFDVARRFVAAELGWRVVGSLLSLAHDTTLRSKLRRTVGEAIPGRHRLKLAQEAARAYERAAGRGGRRLRQPDGRPVAGHAAARARHARDARARRRARRAPVRGARRAAGCVSCSSPSRASSAARAARSARPRSPRSAPVAVAPCRPLEFDRDVDADAPEHFAAGALRLGPWRGVGYIAEDLEVIPHDLDGLDDARARRRLMRPPRARLRAGAARGAGAGGAGAAAEDGDVARTLGGADVARYAERHALGAKMRDNAWTAEDRAWSRADSAWQRATFKYEDSPRRRRRRRAARRGAADRGGARRDDRSGAVRPRRATAAARARAPPRPRTRSVGATARAARDRQPGCKSALAALTIRRACELRRARIGGA